MEIKNATEEMDRVPSVSRRRFFQLAGGIAGAGVLLAACRKKSPPTNIYLGEDDIALLNFFYIIEQLEANFYIQAVATPYYSMTVSESQMLVDVRDQEIAHMEYLRALLGKRAVMDISVNFSAVTFADRASVLKYATILEDMAVSAINGSARLFADTKYVLALAKIATVEARHSACFRDLLSHNTFADKTVIDVYGLDQAQSPGIVFEQAKTFIHTHFDSSRLPN